VGHVSLHFQAVGTRLADGVHASEHVVVKRHERLSLLRDAVLSSSH
jgi:hypothetical protein